MIGRRREGERVMGEGGRERDKVMGRRERERVIGRRRRESE